MTSIHDKATLKCVFCGRPPHADPAWPLEAVAVASDEPGAEHLLDVRAVHGRHGIEPFGMVWTFDNLTDEAAASSTAERPVVVITDADASLVADGRATPQDLVEAAAGVWRNAREAERLAAAAARTAIRYAASEGLSEREIERLTGLARLTVRKALGKEDR